MAAHDAPVAAAPSSYTGWRGVMLLLPKILLTALLALAIGDMIAGVFLRYVMVPITDYLNLPTINFFWVEETGEFSLAWLTLVGAGIGIAERSHFTLRLVVHRLPLRAQQAIHVVNHLLIAVFGALAAWYGVGLVIMNSTLTSPGLQINLGWLYASSVVGGGLIVLYALGMLAVDFPRRTTAAGSAAASSAPGPAWGAAGP